MSKMRKIGKIVIVVLVLLGIFKLGDIFFYSRQTFSDSEATKYILSFTAVVILGIIIVYLIRKNRKK